MYHHLDRVHQPMQRPEPEPGTGLNGWFPRDRRLHCHSAAFPSALSRCFNMDGEGASAEQQSRQCLQCSRQHAVSPSTFSRCFNMDGEGASAEPQSRQWLQCRLTALAHGRVVSQIDERLPNVAGRMHALLPLGEHPCTHSSDCHSAAPLPSAGLVFQ